MSNFIIIPETIVESPISSGYLEITGRHVEKEGFTVCVTSLMDNTRSRVHILTDETGKQHDITLRFDGVFGSNGHNNIYFYSAEILLKPGKYTVESKD